MLLRQATVGNLCNNILRRTISRWLAEEDSNLLQLHEQFGPSWSVISKQCPGRNAIECRRRYLKLTNVIVDDAMPVSSSVSETAKAAARLRRQENDKIRAGWERTEGGDWIMVPVDEVGVSPFHQLSGLVPRFKHRWDRKGWLPEEKRVILEGAFEFAATNDKQQWSRIAKGLQRRTGDQCRKLYEREFILHVQSGDAEIDELKERLFAEARDGRNERRILVQTDD